jgi:hypothetical protein
MSFDVLSTELEPVGTPSIVVIQSLNGGTINYVKPERLSLRLHPELNERWVSPSFRDLCRGLTP